MGIGPPNDFAKGKAELGLIGSAPCGVEAEAVEAEILVFACGESFGDGEFKLRDVECFGGDQKTDG